MHVGDPLQLRAQLDGGLRRARRGGIPRVRPGVQAGAGNTRSKSAPLKARRRAKGERVQQQRSEHHRSGRAERRSLGGFPSFPTGIF